MACHGDEGWGTQAAETIRYVCVCVCVCVCVYTHIKLRNQA